MALTRVDFDELIFAYDCQLHGLVDSRCCSVDSIGKWYENAISRYQPPDVGEAFSNFPGLHSLQF